jgi:hypothetical protein
VDPDGQAAWIAEHCDLPLRDVALILDIENEYLAALGIAIPPDDYEFRYYDPAEVEDGDFVAADAVARDVERLVGIDPEVTHRVLEGELRFLEMRGLA